MADATVLALLQQLQGQVSALGAQVTALSTTVTQAAAQSTTAQNNLRQLISDVQIAVLHVQDTLGQAGGQVGA